MIDDPFGLAHAEVDLVAGGSLLVYPRLVALDRLFSESGAHAQDGRRLLLRRPSGFDLHSVREYEQGESLRKVHWRTTARRGQLMVKELEDAPRDEIAVVLDAQASAVAGKSFDEQVRAAGSILRSHASHGRRAVLAVNSASRPSVRVSSLDGDWLVALGLLAAAEADGARPVVELLARDGGPASRAVETVVVTATCLRSARDDARAALARGAGRQRGVDRRPELPGPSDAHRARAAPPSGRRGRRRGRPARRLAHGGARRDACSEARAWLEPQSSTPSRRSSSPSRGCGWRTRRRRGSMAGGCSCSRSHRRWRRRSCSGSPSPCRLRSPPCGSRSTRPHPTTSAVSSCRSPSGSQTA